MMATARGHHTAWPAGSGVAVTGDRHVSGAVAGGVGRHVGDRRCGRLGMTGRLDRRRGRRVAARFVSRTSVEVGPGHGGVTTGLGGGRVVGGLGRLLRRRLLRCGLLGRLRGLLRLLVADEPLTLGLAPHAVGLRFDDTRRVALHTDAERHAQVEALLVRQAELSCELVHPDVRQNVVLTVFRLSRPCRPYHGRSAVAIPASSTLTDPVLTAGRAGRSARRRLHPRAIARR